MSGKFKTILLTLAAVLFFVLPESKATHIVGGDMTYRCLGDNYFELTVTFTRDCEFGADDARFDDFAIVAIYDQNYNPVNLGANGLLKIPFSGDYIIETSLDNDCEIVGDEVCVHQTMFRDTVYMLPKKGGYIFSYQRCCRNSTLRNLVDPLETGSTQTIRLTDEAMSVCNSSPTFNNWPDIYICNNQSIDAFHAATDPDGDSLVYKLFSPFHGASVKNPRPDRFDEFHPPFETLEWADGYSVDNMMGGIPLSLDPNTGFLTGTPEQPGQYVVGIMVEEYRNGVLLSTVRRDFEYNVRLCLDPPVADFEAPDVLCGPDFFTVNFINTSQNADSYIWEFDWPSNDPDKISTEENPVYTYPNDDTFSGRDTFIVTLKATRDSDLCFDSISKEIIVIEDPIFADFNYVLEDCPGDSLQLHFTDLSLGLNPLYTVNEWNWTITLVDGSVITGSGIDFYTTIPKQNIITVKLEIGSDEGCDASIEKQIQLEYVELSFLSNPIAMCKGDSTKVVANPNSAWIYTWEPLEGLYFENIADKSDPICFIDHDTTYYVTVTDGICTLVDSVDIIVQDYLDIAIEGPDFVCEDSITLVALGGEPGITVFEWAETDDFNPVVAEGDTVSFFINGYEKTYYLRVKEGTGCSNTIDSITVLNNSIDLDYPEVVQYCYGMERDIEIVNKRPGDTIIWTWEASPYIISALDSNVVTIFADGEAEFDLVFHAINQFGCELMDTIHVISSEGPPMVIETEYICDSFKYCFSAYGGTADCYLWDFGVENISDDVSSEANPCYEYPGPGTYTVTVTGCFPECGDSITLTKEVIVPEIFELIAEDTIHYCEGDAIMLSVNPTNFSLDINWYNEDNDSIGTGIMIEYSPQGDETVTVVGVDTFGCIDSTRIFLDMFEFDLSQDNPGTLCLGDTIDLSVYNNTTDELSYEWADHESIISTLDESTITVVLTEDHDYTVTVTSVEHGCTTELTIPVFVSWVDIEIVANPDTAEMVITKTIEFTVTGDYDPATSEILWSTGEQTETISITPTEDGIYTYCVTVTDEYGCFDEDCFELLVIDPPCNEEDIFIPNAFSPNQDGVNETFTALGRYLEEVEITIYDRWGEEIFHIARGPDNGGYEEAYWDGTYKNEYLSPDAFAYLIRVVCEDNDRYEAIGDINLIK